MSAALIPVWIIGGPFLALLFLSLTYRGGTSTGSVTALASYNGELYAGGNFVIYPTPLNPAVDFAHWNTSAHLWEPVNTTFGQTDGTVRAFLNWSGELLVVGDFVNIGSTLANHIARFNGSSFLPWGSGHTQAISSIGIYNGNIAIGSSFSTPTGFSPTVFTGKLSMSFTVLS